MALRAADDRTRSAILAAGALSMALLAGCAEQGAPPARDQTARLPNEGFFFDQDGGEAKLAYGRANSDDVRLMLTCEAGKRQVEITDAAHGQARAGDMLVLTSGKARSALAASLEPNDETGGKLAIAHADPALPALDGFRRSGEIAVKLGSREYALSATAGERAGIARFFSVCERR
ncbi:MAG: hypothetical protein ACXWKY_20525 [Caulobacteraceae bacterium]